jgi:hypothetical protein
VFLQQALYGQRYDGTQAEFSEPLLAMARTPAIAVTSRHSDNQNEVAWHALQILFDAGTGLVTGQGSDPQAMLRWSNDNGYTYGNSHWASFGKIGQYGLRVIWRKLGRAYNRVYELRVTDPVNATIVSGFGQIDRGGKDMAE